MLNPGVGTLTLTAPPRPKRVCAESVLVAPACAAFTCKLMETGMRLPPITRNAAWPPKDVRLSLAPFCFHDAMPAVSVMFANPSEPPAWRRGNRKARATAARPSAARRRRTCGCRSRLSVSTTPCRRFARISEHHAHRRHGVVETERRERQPHVLRRPGGVSRDRREPHSRLHQFAGERRARRSDQY